MSGTSFVDLSVRLESGMPVFPGDPHVSIKPALAIDSGDEVNVLSVEMGSQTGTHVDAPFHILEGGAKLDEIPLDRFMGPAVVADVRGLEAEAPIDWMDLVGVHDTLRPGVILLLHTGWSRWWGDMDRYRQHPWLTAEAARRIVETGVRTVGIDALNVDATPDDLSDAVFDTHVPILSADGVIVENLTGLENLDRLDLPIVSLFPLNIAHADGAPVRAVAFDGAAVDSASQVERQGTDPPA